MKNIPRRAPEPRDDIVQIELLVRADGDRPDASPICPGERTNAARAGSGERQPETQRTGTNFKFSASASRSRIATATPCLDSMSKYAEVTSDGDAVSRGTAAAM